MFQPTSLKHLMARYPQPGRLVAIGVRPERRVPLVSCKQVRMEPGLGLIGDRFKGTEASKRQVSLIQLEHVQAVAAMLGLAALEPLLLRRNLVISGLNLLALKGQRFRLGTALLAYSGPCEPCSRMEELLGHGGYNAMRGHGGIVARVLEGGSAQIGDELQVLPSDLWSDEPPAVARAGELLPP